MKITPRRNRSLVSLALRLAHAVKRRRRRLNLAILTNAELDRALR